MNTELARIWKEGAMAYSRYHPGIYLDELKKTMKNVRRDIQCPGRDANQATPEY
jgi:hypothetical protein